MRECGVRTIDFLKLDCEGAEFEILFGCDDDTFHAIGRMSLEIHNTGEGNNADTMRSLLEGKGFDVRLGPYSLQAVNRSAPVPLAD
jgi:hypothetical protein